MNSLKVFVLLFFIVGCTSKKVQPLINAHSHNDYEHKHPLTDALKNHFISVEADVHLINNELYVSHDDPQKLDSLKTLENLYLRPLQKIISDNQGSIYPGYDGFFYLLIDIKTEASPSYIKLKTILKDYQSVISKVVNGKEEENKPIKIVITGHKGRPFNQILADEPRLVSIDGRYNELGKNINADIMPYISENYNNYLSYKGSVEEGEPSMKDKTILSNMVKDTHKEGKKLRFWASPDNEAVWGFLLDHNVDLINTDSLPKFMKYMSKRIK